MRELRRFGEREEAAEEEEDGGETESEDGEEVELGEAVGADAREDVIELAAARGASKRLVTMSFTV